MIYQVSGNEKIKTLFGEWQESMIWSCLQGVMGSLYADSEDDPKSAMAIVGDFGFLAGEPNRELVAYREAWRNEGFIIITTVSPDWFRLIEEVFPEQAKKVTRYAIKKEPEVFNRENLLRLAGTVAKEFHIQLIDQDIFERCKEQEWSRDLVGQFQDYAHFQKLGVGVVAIKNGEIASGASTYSRYRDGIEVEIDTKEEYRHQGLATACGARLLLECLDRGLYPSWDAQNLWSVAIAEKLGYHVDHAYTAYEIDGRQVK